MMVNSICWSATAWPMTANGHPFNWWTRAAALRDPNSCHASPRSRTLVPPPPSCLTPTSRPSSSPIRWKFTSSAPFKYVGTSALTSAAGKVVPPVVTFPSGSVRRLSHVVVVMFLEPNDRMLVSTESSRLVNKDPTYFYVNTGSTMITIISSPYHLLGWKLSPIVFYR